MNRAAPRWCALTGALTLAAACGDAPSTSTATDVGQRPPQDAALVDAYVAGDFRVPDAWAPPVVDARVRDARLEDDARLDAQAVVVDATRPLDGPTLPPDAPQGDAAPEVDSVAPEVDAAVPVIDAEPLGDVQLAPPSPRLDYEPCACPAPQVCDRGRCAQAGPCSQDADCVAGWSCLGGECVDCALGDGCPGATVCQGVTCVDARQCVMDDACVAGRRCSGAATCVPLPACPSPDAVDVSDPERTLALGPGLTEGFGLCESLDDWFTLETAVGARVTTRSASDQPTPTVWLYPAGDLTTAVDRSLGVAGTAWAAAPAGVYWVRVSAPPGASGPYSVEVVEGCDDDRFERPWRNDTAGSARPLPLEAIDGTLCHSDVSADEDWFTYALDEPARVALETISGRVEATVEGQRLPADIVRGDQVRVRGDHAARWRLVTTRRADPAGRCIEAPVFGVGDTVPVSVVGGRNDFDVPCLSPGTPDAVYRLDLPVRTSVSIVLDTLLPQSGLAILPACDAAALPYDCSEGGRSLRVPSLNAGSYWVVVEGPVNGTLSAFVDQEAGCAGAREAVVNANVPLDPAMPPGRFEDSCLQSGAGESIVHFTLNAASQVFLEARSEGRPVRVALRGACSDVSTELACQSGPGVNIIAPFVPAGDYDVIVESDGPVLLRMNAFAP